MITLTTNVGKILIELDEENAPKTCANFIAYIIRIYVKSELL